MTDRRYDLHNKIEERDAEWQEVVNEFGFPWKSIGDVNELPPHTIAEIVQRMAEEIVRLRSEFQQMAAIATKQKMRIDWLEGHLHTCHDKCQKAGCVATRERTYSAQLRDALIFAQEVIHDEFCSTDHHPFCVNTKKALAIKPPGGEE